MTTQYLHSAEQPRPLVRLSIPADALTIKPSAPTNALYDCEWPKLYLVITAPPALLHTDPDAAKRPVSWPLNLLLFEYIMRLARGGTYNVLAAECALSLRNLKDHLLSTFATTPTQRESVEFFVTERHSYVLKKLRFDEDGCITLF
ncbi:hypothetical protein [Candidatus Viridilinea mediisalina]|uniref:hypothetical protein n=1 Tax=Candidatus Viridilinea mediisalina TaxID=2024553 RepID=UPI000F5A71D5|nr:hypothetical protein [Candidatus Viridilinea mediisalina]